MTDILLVEDEANIASFIKRGLNEFGYNVTVAYNGEDGWKELQSRTFGLLIFDIIMPGMNGLELCRRYREQYGYKMPVLLLTALGTTQNIVEGLQAGADDYIVKPFSFMELEARIKALLRRNNLNDVPTQDLRAGDLTLNLSTHQALRQGKVIDLTIRECRLLECFIRHKGVVLSRKALLKDVWDKNFDTNTNIVDVYVNYLRNKIDKDFDTKHIRTVVGVGYIME